MEVIQTPNPETEPTESLRSNQETGQAIMKILDKFDGEPDYVLEFWNRAIAGQAHDDRNNVYIFNITEKDHRHYPELPVASQLYLIEDSVGFILSLVLEAN
jgi:hypothetical protein